MRGTSFVAGRGRAGGGGGGGHSAPRFSIPKKLATQQPDEHPLCLLREPRTQKRQKGTTQSPRKPNRQGYQNCCPGAGPRMSNCSRAERNQEAQST